MHRLLLWRRSIDPILLSVVVAAFRSSSASIRSCWHSSSAWGGYLIGGWRQSRRLIDPWYAAASLACGVVTITIGLYHGDVIENLRWIGLPLCFALGIPLFVGFVLIKGKHADSEVIARSIPNWSRAV